MIAEKRFYTILSSSTDYCELAYDAELQALVLTYKRSCTKEEYRSTYHKLLETLKKVPVGRILVNMQHLGTVTPEDQRWLGQTMLPMLANATPNKHLFVAVFVPDNIFAQLAAEHIEELAEASGSCTNRHFATLAAAKMWLREQTLP